MNRSSRRADDEAEALLEAGRTQPVLRYDVESGLARHHQWLRSEVPLPEWASASAGGAAGPWAHVAIKTLVSALLIGVLAIGIAVFRARDHAQPGAAITAAAQATPAAVPTRPAVSSVPNSPATGTSVASVPMPVPERDLQSDRPAVTALRAARVPRARREVTNVLATNAPPADALPAHAAAEHLVQRDVTATSEPVNVPEVARPEPEPRAQRPDDLAEMRHTSRAERLVQRSPERALALVHEGDQLFAGGYFRQERAYIAIMALIRLGRIDEARARAESFARQFPARPYGVRIRSALEATTPYATDR